MKKIPQNKIRWFGLVALLLSFQTYAQTYYAKATGNWGAGASWSTDSCAGANALSIPSTTGHSVSISCNRTITVASNASAGALTISSGGLTVNSGTTLTVTSLSMTSGTLTVNGTLNITVGGTGVVSITGGTVSGTGTVGLTGGAQNLSSSQPFYNLNIAGAGNKTMLTSINVTNQLTLTANNLIVGSNTLTVGSASSGNGIVRTNGKMTLAAGSSLSFGGSWDNNDLSPFISNTFPLTINNFTMTRNLCKVGLGTGHNLTVAGSFTLTAGDFSIGNSTLTLNGAISGNINGSIVGGSTSDLVIGGSGAASMYFDLTSFQTVGGSNTIRNFTNNRTSHPFVMLSSMRIGGTLTEVTNASLQISNGSTQTLSIDGNVSGTAKLVGNSAAILQINGSGDMGGTLAFASTPVLASLTIDRLSGSATLGSAVSTGGLSLKKGVLINNFLTTVTGSTPGNVVQELSSSYLRGALARTIASNTNATAYSWPIGKTAAQKFSFNGLATGASGNVVVSVEAFDGNSNGTPDSTISNLKTDNYWNASVISNAANLQAVGSVSLNDNGLSDTDAIGYAATVSGQYTSLGGAIAAGTITSVTDSPVALGFYNLGTAESGCVEPTTATINASATTNCGTTATTLSIAAGSLNSATNWAWYSGSCGGTAVGTGTSVTVSPTATTTYYVRGEGGCVTPGDCASVTITVNTPQLWYADADADSYGNPGVSQLACSQPANYVGDNTDCDDADNTMHQKFSFYADNDGDGFGFGNLVMVCAAGANTPPDGYAANNTDCNDTDAGIYQSAVLFVDADHDGYTSGVTETVCYGLDFPLGYLAGLTAIDCDDAIAAIHPTAIEIPYNGVDDNCDGAIDETGTVTTTLLAASCGVTLTSIQSLIGIQTVGGHQITGYRIRATNGSQIQTIERNVPHFTMTQFPIHAYATTYTIAIQLQRAGIWQASWGQSCVVSTPPILEEGGAGTVSPSQCGITLPKINTLIASGSISGVTAYRFRVTNLTDPLGPNAVQTIDRTQNWFSLQMLTRYNYGTTYRIEVAVKIGGAFGGYGSPCEVSSPPAPSLVNCGAVISSGTATVAAPSVSGATQYRFRITRASDNASTIMDRNTNWFIFNSVPAAAFSPGVLYYVKVAVMTTGSWSPFGDICEVTSPGTPAAKPSGADDAMVFKTSVSPNPFDSEFVVRIDSESKMPIEVKIYDMLGRLVERQTVASADRVYMGSHFPSGVYNLIVTQEGVVRTIRVVKR